MRRTRIVIILNIYYSGEACLAPTKPCGGKAIDVIYCSYRARTRITDVAIIHSKTSFVGYYGRGFYYGVPWRAATTAMLFENTQRAFYGRGMPRPYKALRRQG